MTSDEAGGPGFERGVRAEFRPRAFCRGSSRAQIVSLSQVAAGIDDVRHFAQQPVEPTTALGKAAVEAAESPTPRVSIPPRRDTLNVERS